MQKKSTVSGFVLHKVVIRRCKGHYSVWADSGGTMIDCEQIIRVGKSTRATIFGSLVTATDAAFGTVIGQNPPQAGLTPLRSRSALTIYTSEMTGRCTHETVSCST